MHHRRLQGQLAMQVGQQTRHPARQHRLAGARRTDEQQMVAARRCHLERQARHRLPLHVGQIVQFGLDERRRQLVEPGPRAGAREGVDELIEPVDRAHHAAPGDPRLGDRPCRDHPVVVGPHAHHRRHTWNRANRTVEPEFAGKCETTHDVGGNHLERHQRSHCDGDIEP